MPKRLFQFVPLRFLSTICCWAVLVSSCIDPYNPIVIQEDYSYLVVEGFLVNGMDPTIIKLSRTQTLTSIESPLPESNATVQIENESGDQTTLTNNHDGTYSVPSLSLDVTQNYRLKISTPDSKEYASDFVPIKRSPPIDSVMWTEDSESLQFFVSTHDPENKTVYYLWTYEETWEYSSKFYSIYKYEDGQVKTRDFSNELYYCWKSAPSPNIFLWNTKNLSSDVVNHRKLHRLLQVSRKLEYGYSLLVKQHALSKEAYEYWETLKKNNENLGTLFDRTPSQDIGNIHCLSHPDESVLGYFSAASISAKRIFIERQEIIGPHARYEPSGYEDCSEKFLPASEINDNRLKGLLLIDKKFDLNTQEFLGYIVSSADCVDCRFHGGNNVRPGY